jgi:hypothetical protein
MHDSNVITLNGRDYAIDDLGQEERYIIECVREIVTRRGPLERDIFLLNTAQDALIEQLRTMLTARELEATPVNEVH